MKKLVFLILFISAINEIKAENKVEIIDYVGTELQFIINRSTENNQLLSFAVK